MNTAQLIKIRHTDSNNQITDYDAFVADCENLTDDVEQNFANETTTYTFADSSVLVWSAFAVLVFGS